MNRQEEILLVGGGAGGLATAIFAAEAVGKRRGDLRLLERKRKLGAKILVSGGGRCNVAPDEATVDDFNGSARIVRSVLRAFGPKRVASWFASLGVELKREESGKLFPVSDSAQTVLDAMLRRCRDLGVGIETGCRVDDVAVDRDGRFVATTGEGRFSARRLVLATGGCSLPKSGSDGLGYEIVRRLGHTVTPIVPALVPLVLDRSFLHRGLSGISLPVALTVEREGRTIAQRVGEMLLTHFGVSGPVVLDISRHWVMAHAARESVALRCSFVAGEGADAFERWLVVACSSSPKQTVRRILARRLPERLAGALLHHAGVDPTERAATLSRSMRRQIANAVVRIELPVVGHRGWNAAEVTAGGVPLEEIDPKTMESRICPGLYLVGEILDCDGRIGGFNFQWAWSTAYVAGCAIQAGG